MSSNQPDNTSNVRTKVAGIFRELVGERVSRLDGSHYNHNTAAAIAGALAASEDDRTARDIAFHLTDWNSDAAFIVALQLFPERFTADEIASGVERFLIHAPNHVTAAAVLSSWPAEDIFGVASPNSDEAGNS
ncbi:MAG: hypothetical protein P4L99_19475 [Chthoniobacter sp.]|nr:hypothetical protein [Chthoniobacter sp.]